MNEKTILQRLSAHRILSAVPQNEMEWIARHAVVRFLEPGAVVTAKGEQVSGLHIVLSGRLVIYVTQGAGTRKVQEWREGDIGGLLPYSRMVGPPGDVTADEQSELLTVSREHLPEMIRECPELTAKLVHVMLDRARHFTSSFLHDEKLVSLGKLAAGLAHELNNPVSAIARSASALSAARLRADASALALGACNLTPEQMAAVDKVRTACISGCTPLVLSPLQQEERENAMVRWLKKNGADVHAAEALAETDLNFEMLDQLTASLKGSALNSALAWIAADSATHLLTSEIQVAAGRVHDLVKSIKDFTEMDRAAIPEPVDIHQGLSNTLVVLRAKAKSKSVELRIHIDDRLPPIHGFASELNQVWVNLIDNALDASPSGSCVEVSVHKNANTVVVKVIDGGAGIPAEIRDRIFDPFFTTKPVGQGTGLGLDIVRRLIQRHNGQIELESIPGRTEFRVVLPADDGSLKAPA